jgi:hypothetical protein
MDLATVWAETSGAHARTVKPRDTQAVTYIALSAAVALPRGQDAVCSRATEIAKTDVYLVGGQTLAVAAWAPLSAGSADPACLSWLS